MGFDLGGLLQQYIGGNAASAGSAEDHFHQAAQSASPDLLSEGLSAMFRSDQTPAFGQMAGQLFGQASGTQQAGMLNELINRMGPGVLSSLVNGAGGGALGAILGQLTQGGTAAITPSQASQVTPEQVEVIAAHAEKHDPSIVDSMSSFYAQHAGLIKTLGGAALTIALAKMAERQRS